MMHTRVQWWLWPALVTLLLAVSPPRAVAQMLSGEWVNASDKQIEEHRKTRLRVLVLDASGQPRPMTMVTVTQQAHAFTWGVAAAAVPEAQPLPGVWRCFNALSLEPVGDLMHTRPLEGAPDFAAVEAKLATLPRGWTARWGGVISADPNASPAWVSQKRGVELEQALNTHAAQVVERYSGRVRGFDLYTHLIDHNVIEARLGGGAVRGLFENVLAANPRASLGVRFDDALEGPRLPLMIQRVRSLREAFVPFDHIALGGRYGGTLVHATLRAATDWIAQLDMPVTIASLEVGGGSPAAAAINMEMVLRTFFSQPSIQGIYLSGLTKAQVTDPTAALLGDDGSPTPVGELFERMTRGLWWTDTQVRTDLMGNARTKVFAGRYTLSVDYGDGNKVSVDVWLPVAEGERTVVLQPLKDDPAE